MIYTEPAQKFHPFSSLAEVRDLFPVAKLLSSERDSDLELPTGLGLFGQHSSALRRNL